jgi:hypothetical protein
MEQVGKEVIQSKRDGRILEAAFANRQKASKLNLRVFEDTFGAGFFFRIVSISYYGNLIKINENCSGVKGEFNSLTKQGFIVI